MTRVLIIDDEALVLQTLGAALRRAGFQVETAEDGGEGLEVFRRAAPDVVVTDIIMPGTEGIETIVQLRRERPSLLIIAMSGGARTVNVDLLEVAHKLGADAVLRKPFRPQELVARVLELLAARP